MRKNSFLLLAVTALSVALAAACDGDDGGTSDTPATATAEPTRADTTGIEAVDRVLTAVKNGDPVAFEALLRAQTIPCSNATGAGGPPQCFNAPGNDLPEGTPVDVFPYDTCEREWQFDLGDFTTRILERINDLYAVVRIDPVTPPAELAEGAYGIIYPDATGFATSHALIVTDNGVVSVDSLCGGTADSFLDDGPPFYGPEVILEGPAFN